jgi:hypothetical protein
MSVLGDQLVGLRKHGVGGLSGVRKLHQGYRFGRDLLAPSARVATSAVGDEPDNPLSTYFDAHMEGRGIWKWRHYFDVYHRHFSKFVGTHVHVLEIGVYSGGSLDMWREYFGPGCRVYGVDIEPACQVYASDSVRIFIGDQADPRFWDRFRREVPHLDIVIDDGGHLAQQQVATLEGLLLHLRPGGVYVCEDVRGVGNPFHAYIAGLSENLHATRSTSSEAGTPTEFQRLINSVHVYPYITAIERSQVPLADLVAPRHGTEWQPFLDRNAEPLGGGTARAEISESGGSR